MKGFKTITAAALIAAAALALGPVHAQQVGSSRVDLQRRDISAPGREIVQSRVQIDPGMVSPRHRHPGEEIVYVLAGSFEYRLEGQAPARLNAGDVLFIPARTFHVAENVGDTPAVELAVYVVEKGQPLAEIVE